MLGFQSITTTDATSVRIKTSTSDPISTCSISVHDDTLSINPQYMQELWVIDDTVIPNPSWNLLMAPTLEAGDTGYWAATSTAGFGGTVDFSGAPPVTASVLNDNHVGYALRFQNIQTGLIVPGQEYMLSCYLRIGGSMVNANSILKFGWVDATGTYLGDAVADYRDNTNQQRLRYSMSAVAPANAASAQIAFGIQTTAQPVNSGTALFDSIQFEPVWWPNTLAYPTPDLMPTYTNVTALPNQTYIRQYRKFAGFVNHFIAQDYHGNVRTWHIDAMGYAWLFGMTLTATAFTNQTDSAIISSLIAFYYGQNSNVLLSGLNLFNLSNVVTGATLTNLQPNWDDLRTVMDNLAAQAGFFWTVDGYWNLLYEPPGYTQMPIALICDSSANPDFVTTFPAYDVQAETDYTQPGSVVLVLGGNTETTLTVALTHMIPVTTLHVAGMADYVPINTVMSVSGNQGITLSAAAHIGDTTLSIFSFTPLADYSVGTFVTTNPYVGLVIDPVQTTNVNRSNLYGFADPNNILMRKVNDSALQSPDDVSNRAIAEIIQYDNPRQIYHATTNVELLVGQGIQVTDNPNGYSSTTLLIQEVTASWIGKDETLTDVWEYKAQMGNVNRAAASILSHIFRQTTLNQSAPAITQTSLFTMEKVGIVDTADYPYVLAVMADLPIAFYRMTESGGTTAYDYSGNIYNGTISGTGVFYGAAGPIAYDPDTALFFDGAAGNIISVAGAKPAGWTAFSVEGWFSLTTLALSAQPAIVANDKAGVNNTGFAVYLGTTGQTVNFVMGTGSGSHTTCTLNYQLTTDQYYYFCCTWDGEAMTVNVYNTVDKSSHSAAVAFAGPFGNGGNNVGIAHNPAGTDYLPANMADVAWYANTALSQTRQRVHFDIGVYGHALSGSGGSPITPPGGVYGTGIYGSTSYS